MTPAYILDACALLAVLAKESGDEVVNGLFKKALNREITLIMNKNNLLEVYYDIYREYGKDDANKFLEQFKLSPTIIINELTDDLFKEAGRLKASYKISFADSFAVAQTIISNGTLITADSEFEELEKNNEAKFLWIR
jgi:predicted nucleic acid-binding protein